jgi:hypothetical protein
MFTTETKENSKNRLQFLKKLVASDVVLVCILKSSEVTVEEYHHFSPKKEERDEYGAPSILAVDITNGPP